MVSVSNTFNWFHLESHWRDKNPVRDPSGESRWAASTTKTLPNSPKTVGFPNWTCDNCVVLLFVSCNPQFDYKPQLQATRAKHVLVKWCQVGSAKQVFSCCTKYLAFIQWLQGLQILMTSAIQNAKLHSLSPRGLRESESIRVYTSETVQKRSKTTLPFFQRHLMRYTNYTSTNTETEHSCTALFKFCGREP